MSWLEEVGLGVKGAKPWTSVSPSFLAHQDVTSHASVPATTGGALAAMPSLT